MGFKGGLIGCGYYAKNHLHAWRDTDGAEIVAVCDLDGARAREAARVFGIPRWYGEAAAMLSAENLDFVDVVTQAPSHRMLVELAAGKGIHVICQKPMASSLADARAMVVACRRAGVVLMVHENFRWQRPMRAVKAELAKIGDPFFGRLVYRHNHDVFSRQPYLAEQERFILNDMGVHLLDLARFFLGEVSHLFCHAQRVNPRVRGEDTATVSLAMQSGATCVVEMCAFSHHLQGLFPQTLVHIEGRRGSVSLGPDYALTVVAGERATQTQTPPLRPVWAKGMGAEKLESVGAIQQHWVECLEAGEPPETSGLDQLKTLELVMGAYESAETGMVYRTEAALGEGVNANFLSPFSGC